MTATVEASSQVKMKDGSMGRRLIFQAWSVRHNIAITPDGPVPYGEVVVRPNSGITKENGTFTFADIRQTNGTLIPVSIRVRPTSGRSPGGQHFGRVIETLIATADAYDHGWGFFNLERGKSFKPPFPLTFQPNQGPAFVELTPELKEWIKASRVDFLVHLGEKTWDMMTLEMQEEFAGQLNEWKTIPPEKVIGVFAKKDAAHLVRDEVPAASFGHSYRGEYGAVTAFRTRSNTMGVYQIQGMGNINRRGVGIRYKLVQDWLAKNENPGSLLPEITQVLGAVEGNTTHWLDLDTGRQMPLSFPDDEAAKLALFRTNGLDLMGIVTKEEMGVACREMVVRQVEGSRWDRATAEEIIAETPSAQFGPGADAVNVITTNPGRKVTMFFRTREGGLGILQITGQSKNPLGVKIRYKLVKTTTSSQGRKSAQGRQIADSGEVSVCNRNG